MTVPIKYRISSVAAKPVADSVKGVPLTSLEIDGNFRSIKDAIEDFSESTGSSLVGHRDGKVQGVLDAVTGSAMYLKKYIPEPGIGDDTTGFLAALAALDHGQCLEFEAGATYLINGSLRTDKRNITVNGNGATLKQIGSSRKTLQIGGFDAIYGTAYGGGSGTSLALPIVQNSRTVAATGLTAATKGKLVIIYDAVTLRPETVAGGAEDPYYFGHLREVESYDGTALTVTEPFDVTHTATTVEVYTAPFGCTVNNLAFGSSGRTSANFDDNEAGIMVRGIGCKVVSSIAQNFFHRAGGSVRTGYGIEIAGTNCKVIDSFGLDSKHCFATTERRFFDRGLKVVGGSYQQSPELFDVKLADGVTGLILWPIDVHANAETVVFDDVDGSSPSFVAGIRNGSAVFNGGQLKNTRTSGSLRFGAIVFETAVSRLEFNGTNLDVGIPVFWAATGVNRSVKFVRAKLQQSLRIGSLVGSFDGFEVGDCDFAPVENDCSLVDLHSIPSDVAGLKVYSNRFDMTGRTNVNAVLSNANTVLQGGDIFDNEFKPGVSGTRGIRIASTSITETLRVSSNRFPSAPLAVDIEMTGSGNYILQDNVTTGTVTLEDMEYRRRPIGNTFATIRPKPFPESGLRIGSGSWYFDPANASSRPVHGVFLPNEIVKTSLVNLGSAGAFVNRTSPVVAAAPYSSSWTATTPVTKGTQVKMPGGQVFVAFVGGTTGATAPTVPASLYGTVVDGTVTWKYLCAVALELWSPIWQSGTRLLSGTPPTSNPRMEGELAQVLVSGIYKTFIARPDNIVASSWTAARVIPAGGYIYPTTANGFVYSSTAGGTTSGTEPTWPTSVNATVVDGGVTWVCRELWTGLN